MEGVYLPPPPTRDRAEFEDWLDGLGACVRRLQPGPVLVAEDFNSWSVTWSSRLTNIKGVILEDWAAALGLFFFLTG